MKVDSRIRRDLPYFLGAPDDWRGCFIPFEPAQVSMFQIGYQASFAKRWETAFPRRGLRGVDMSSANLLNYLDEAGVEGVGTTLEAHITTKNPNRESMLSNYGKHYVNLKTPVMAGLGMHLQAGQKKVADLKATVREIKEVPTNHYDSVDEALRQVAPRIIDDLTRTNSNKRPTHIYVVVGTELVDFAATVQSRSALGLGASVAGNEIEAGAGSQMEVLSETNDRIALVRLLKYKTEPLLEEKQKGLTVPSGNPSGSEAAGAKGSGGRLPNTTVSAGTSILRGQFGRRGKDVAGAALDLNDTAVSWTIGQRVPLDADDVVNSGLRTLADTYATYETRLDWTNDQSMLPKKRKRIALARVISVFARQRTKVPVDDEVSSLGSMGAIPAIIMMDNDELASMDEEHQKETKLGQAQQTVTSIPSFQGSIDSPATRATFAVRGAHGGPTNGSIGESNASHHASYASAPTSPAFTESGARHRDTDGSIESSNPSGRPYVASLSTSPALEESEARCTSKNRSIDGAFEED